MVKLGYGRAGRAPRTRGARWESQVISIHPREIERDDRFLSEVDMSVVWTAVEGAVTRADETIRCEVRFADGGLAERVWTALDPTLKIVVKRRV